MPVGFFSLPPELRREIYHYLFPASQATRDLASYSPPPSTKLRLAILLTCRTIHHECHPLAFRSTVWVLGINSPPTPSCDLVWARAHLVARITALPATKLVNVTHVTLTPTTVATLVVAMRMRVGQCCYPWYVPCELPAVTHVAVTCGGADGSGWGQGKAYLLAEYFSALTRLMVFTRGMIAMYEDTLGSAGTEGAYGSAMRNRANGQRSLVDCQMQMDLGWVDGYVVVNENDRSADMPRAPVVRQSGQEGCIQHWKSFNLKTGWGCIGVKSMIGEEQSENGVRQQFGPLRHVHVFYGCEKEAKIRLAEKEWENKCPEGNEQVKSVSQWRFPGLPG